MQRYIHIAVVLGLVGMLTLTGCGSNELGQSSLDAAPSNMSSATTGIVRGRVTTPAGTPIPEVPIGAQSVGNTVPVPALARLTDQDGVYTWQLPTGSYVIMAGTITKTVDLQAGQTVTLDFINP